MSVETLMAIIIIVVGMAVGDYYGFPGSGDSSYYSQYDFDNWEGPWYGGWVYGMGCVYP